MSNPLASFEAKFIAALRKLELTPEERDAQGVAFLRGAAAFAYEHGLTREEFVEIAGKCWDRAKLDAPAGFIPPTPPVGRA